MHSPLATKQELENAIIRQHTGKRPDKKKNHKLNDITKSVTFDQRDTSKVH